jgi:hypothetical protein
VGNSKVKIPLSNSKCNNNNNNNNNKSIDRLVKGLRSLRRNNWVSDSHPESGH